MMGDSTLERLKQIPIFADIRNRPEAMASLAAICRLRTFPAGKTIIQEGDVGSEMFIVHKGAVEIQKRTRAGDDYTVLVLDADDNAFFGELALVDDDKRSATIIARAECEFLVIEKRDFISLGDQHPEIGLPVTRALAKIISGRLRKTTGDMMTIFDALVNELES